MYIQMFALDFGLASDIELVGTVGYPMFGLDQVYSNSLPRLH